MDREGNSDWTEAAHGYLNGRLDAAGVRALEEKLLASPELRAGFRRYARTDAALRESAEAFAEAPPMIESFRDVRPRGAAGFGWRWLQAAAMIAMALGLTFLLVERGGRDASASSVEKPDGPLLIQGSEFSDEALAVLTHAVGVEWDGQRAYAEGAALPPDVLEIAKGLVQIEFFSGATVVVEGPARFELVDPMNARCGLGRVRANVPHFARGFTIESDEIKVVDLGTEFGFSAEPGGIKELHVFDGEVTVEGGVVGGEPRHLLTGTGIRVGEERMDYIPTADEAFADTEQIASLASAAADEQHRAWLRYAEELKANGDVLLFYSFDNQVAWSRRLSNDKKMIADPLYGAIVGCRWAEGRWRGKAALEFKRNTDRVRISVPGEHETVTLMAWVRFDGLDRQYNSLMLSDGWNAGGIHWQVARDGRVIFGVKRQDGFGNYETGVLLGQRHLGQWLHLAVSYDARGGIVRHYLNGVAVSDAHIDSPAKISVPSGELGNWSPGYWPPKGTDVRNLNGRMDEFLVFSSALDEEGVRAIYDKGRPR